ncbi:PilZ domain-containing protein [Sphingomonas bacterium]|uniref:PilZ domain-containing protein n=1 Tax=Sphingomonas bacterium TaxID=1895847 RepID=UPI0015771789|nr:PilZ domain-containing protein [Sphingomonas bacterium]
MDSINRGPLTAVSAAEEDGQRKRKRDSLFLQASITLADEAVARVRIRNLSEGGLMAELPRVVNPGTPVAIDLRGIPDLTGKVAWCAEGRMGIVFDRKIDPQLARKPVGKGAQTPIYAKPPVSFR